jgi:hypothetical protein
MSAPAPGSRLRRERTEHGENRRLGGLGIDCADRLEVHDVNAAEQPDTAILGKDDTP